jgi:hypothetical protein
MWKIEETDDYSKSLKWFVKKRPREARAVLDNLDTFFNALNAGARPQQIKAGFVHPEPCGVLAFDQKGGGPNLAQTRLYVYPNATTEILHLITLGDKSSQRDDIRRCSAFVAELRKENMQANDE